ncbi:hypothetical protein KY290_023776 [Solanum tuberosum]|uniref:Prolyl endopeptidase n=1 Tax=Solanum tuberosum TaxID=4113 RepID=A0ABQ7VAA4_SOLTU|nr:hypothetical protein KY290_023776 [Solanum tuberosum]
MGSLPAIDEPSWTYPFARRDGSVVDNYHGVDVSDPYRWLEDPDSEETKEFVEKQVILTESVLKTCETREKLRKKLTKLFDFPKYDVPFRAGDKYFYFHNTGLQPQKVLYIQDSLDGKPEILLDPNTLSEDGTVSLSICAISEDAKYLAYGISSSGSDWVTIKVMRVEDKHDEPDTILWVKFSNVSWIHDSKGFFYSRYPAPKNGENLDAGRETNANFHQQYVLLYIFRNCDTVNKLYYCDLSTLPNGIEGCKGKRDDALPFNKLVDTFDASYDYVAHNGTIFTFQTNKDAPKYKLIRVDVENPDFWYDIIEEDEKDVLQSAVAVNENQLVVSYLRDVKNVLQLRDLDTGELLHHLPIDIGRVSGISARRKDDSVFIGFMNFLIPGLIYECNLKGEVPDLKVFREIVVPGFDRTEFQVNQVFVPSKDGVKIPMFIVSRKGISLDGCNPCLLFGYGGFNVSITPHFSAARVVLAKHLGVVFCIANIRGGGEYGEEWYKGGALNKKQNCFDDFISAAEYLVSAGYTQPHKLCIEGGSNGGLLVGACVNQRPDLFGCALAHVGVMDMLRFHKFTIGHAWTSDFGCSDKEEEFQCLIEYSPLHNVSRPWEKSANVAFVQYPSIMLLTADHDDRVVPLHSLKLLATMQYILCTSQEGSRQTNPIVGRIERKAGHGCGRPTQKLIDEAADRYAFMAKELGAAWVE